MGCNCFTELGQYDGSGDAPMGGDRERVAGVVVDPVKYFYVGVIGEPQWVKSACQRSLGCSAAKRM